MKLSCTSCNHEFDAAAKGRVECPRCGETVRSGESARPEWERRPPPPFDFGPMVRRRVIQAMIVSLLIMLVVAGFAVKHVLDERAQKLPPPPLPMEAPSPQATAPLELAGLGYLPSNCNLIFAVQPGPLLIYAERTKQDPIELLTRNSVPATALGALAKAGITLQQIDHVVGGFYIPEENEEPRICLVLKFRRPLADEAAFLEQMKAIREGKLVKANDTIWLFGFPEKALASRTGDSQLPAGFRDLIDSRVPKDAAVWIAADSARWSDKPLLKLLKKEWQPVLAKGRAAAGGLTFGESPKLRIAVQTADAASGEKLRSYFKGKATGEHSVSGGSGDWATLELPVEPKDAYAIFKGFLDDAAR